MECEGESRSLLKEDERLCAAGGTAVHQVNCGRSPAEAFLIRASVKISAKLSINTDYMHVDALKET